MRQFFAERFKNVKSSYVRRQVNCILIWNFVSRNSWHFNINASDIFLDDSCQRKPVLIEYEICYFWHFLSYQNYVINKVLYTFAHLLEILGKNVKLIRQMSNFVMWILWNRKISSVIDQLKWICCLLLKILIVYICYTWTFIADLYYTIEIDFIDFFVRLYQTCS